MRAAYQSALAEGCSAEESLDEAAASEIEHLWSVVREAAFEREYRPRASDSDLFVDDRALF
jgi:hypothetical protein